MFLVENFCRVLRENRILVMSSNSSREMIICIAETPKFRYQSLKSYGAFGGQWARMRNPLFFLVQPVCDKTQH